MNLLDQLKVKANNERLHVMDRVEARLELALLKKPGQHVAKEIQSALELIRTHV